MSLPDPALVVLVGASGSGKSTWAAQRYRAEEVVSSDALRGVVGSGPHDLDASADAFAVLEAVVAARLGRGLTTVVDTLGLDAERRRSLAGRRTGGRPAGRGRAARHPRRGVPAPQRRARPAAARRGRWPGSWRVAASVADEVADEGWDLVVPGHARARARLPADPPAAGERREPGGERTASTGVRGGAAGLALPVGRGPAGLAARRRPGRRRGRVRRAGADGPPDPDPPGRPRLGPDPRAVGDARGASPASAPGCGWARCAPRSPSGSPGSPPRPPPPCPR